MTKLLVMFNNMKTKPKVLTGVCIPLFFLLILGASSFFGVNKINHTAKWVYHTYNVLGKADSIVASAVDMETGMRGYLLAGQEQFLDPYKGGEKAVYEQIESLQETVSDNPGQVKRLEEVATTLKEWQANVTEPTIQLRRDIGDAKTMDDMADLVGEARGKQYFDKFRGQIALFKEREEKLLVQRNNKFNKAMASGTANTRLIKDTVKWVNHTYKVLIKADAVLASAVDMETGMRGYLLAGKEEFLEPYNGGKSRFEKQTEDLKKTVSDNPAQVKLMTEIQQTISEWQINVTEPTIQLRRDIGDASTMNDMAKLVGEARGKKYFDKFRGLMSDFKGEEEGLIDVRINEKDATTNMTYTVILACTILSFVVGLILAFFIGNSIAKPIIRTTEDMSKLADGDTSIDVKGLDRNDEVGDMAKALEVFKENRIKADELQKEQDQGQKLKAERAKSLDVLTTQFEIDISELVNTLSAASEELSATAQSMSSIEEETTSQSGSMMSVSQSTVQNIQTMASAAEELTASIRELSEQASKTSNASSEATKDVSNASKQVETLLASSEKIGEVVSMIGDIAEQTNLLALNATIESARAGEAGKGFAVVAQEVKSLASETSKATEQITVEVQSVQSEIRAAVDAIKRIDSKIKDVDGAAASIASAVEEQSATTSEISRNTQESAANMNELDGNVSNVNEAARSTGSAANDVLSASSELSERMSSLKGTVDAFIRSVKQA